MVEHAGHGGLVQAALVECAMKTALITSGNGGLGYECARSLAINHDWGILVACRNSREAEPAWRISQTSNSRRYKLLGKEDCT